MLNLKSNDIQACVSQLADNIRAENIEYDSYINLYSGEENIQNIDNRNNTVIYGRRGSGKTHLLKALQERIIIDFKNKKTLPIYIDIRRIVPLLATDQDKPEINAILIFKYLMQEVAHNLALNIMQISGLNEFSSPEAEIGRIRELNLDKQFSRIYLEFDGRQFTKPTSLTVHKEEIRSLSAAATLSKSPSLSGSGENKTKSATDKQQSSYISILDITNVLECILSSLDLNRITLLLDEWSEIELNTQIYLAEILKKSFSAISVNLKIAAIPNRTNLGRKVEQKFIGLEDGGDIFGYPLDMRYVFEVNKEQTKIFFNDLIYKHLNSINPPIISQLLKDQLITKNRLLNLFYTNVALNEILVASAGIPRDFINLFINSYDKFIIGSASNAKRISVKNFRSANSEWYETDKKSKLISIR